VDGSASNLSTCLKARQTIVHDLKAQTSVKKVEKKYSGYFLVSEVSVA